MANTQNCDSDVNVPSSQTYRTYLVFDTEFKFLQENYHKLVVSKFFELGNIPCNNFLLTQSACESVRWERH
jgi:hypothetical protein